MSDQNQPMIASDAPWYAKTGMQFAMQFGLPALLLMLLLLFLMAVQVGWLPNPVADELKELRAEIVKLSEGQDKIDRNMQQDAGHAIRHDATTQDLIKTLQKEATRNQIKCVLKAKTDDEKKACLHE